ncbi:NDE1, mitochondrial external NADH dehydrogenase [Mycena leptocephala]|nr:NDE1, mitochondrial external NADH dehydrogenase [Mycena leptocephala]
MTFLHDEQFQIPTAVRFTVSCRFCANSVGHSDSFDNGPCAGRLDRLKTASRNFASSAVHQKQRLLILGSGWGGYGVLRGVDKKRWDVTIVSPNNYFNFTPLLASCAVGTLEFRCAVEPVRRYTPQVVAYQAWCDKIDFQQKTVQCMPATPPPIQTESAGTGTPFTLRWDKIVLAAGAYSKVAFGVPGVKEHAHFLKDVKDARAIRIRILECFEQAMQPTLSDMDRRNLLNFCIVGGGPTGVEFASELHDLLHAEIAQHYPIEAGKMFVKERGEVPFGILVWSTGLAPNPLISSISEFKKDMKTKSVLTNEHLNLIRTDGTVDPDVWGIGDCAQIEDAILPATAQVANQKAQYIVKKLNKLVKDQDSPKPFKFENQGSLAYIGDWKAIYDNSGKDGHDKIISKESGRVAWLLWRSAYFTMTLSWRILVPMYWFVSWIFGRDITRF